MGWAALTTVVRPTAALLWAPVGLARAATFLRRRQLVRLVRFLLVDVAAVGCVRTCTLQRLALTRH
jgi:hypothetical protein